MYILVINGGSSSLKYQLFDMDTRKVMAKGLCERIGKGGHMRHTAAGREKLEFDIDIPDHTFAAKLVVDKLTDPQYGVLSDMSQIGAVGHRVLHGGQWFSESVVIDDAVIGAIEKCIPLGPLHNPANLMGIRACAAVMPGVPQVAVFDTAFHQSMPKSSYIYPIPYEFYEKYAIRRYGFHGTSHRYVSGRCAEILGGDPADHNIIVCHLGNGSSLCAVRGGKCFDTSMGLTPLDGVEMGTRSGAIDPAVVSTLCEKTGKSPTYVVDQILNKESGLLGVSGLSSDFRDVNAAADAGNERAVLARDILIHTIRHYIGAYAAEMGRVDALVFTAGIGENNAALREHVTDTLGFMGVEIDREKNLNPDRAEELEITAPGARVRTFVIATNEELMIAMDTERLVAAKTSKND
ncbi:MAG: acetate kinase [Eubacteriales bacterium]|nr:acetate kinase [Eubacteriales bacterium]MDY3285158.1 acetate kinase [Eubacteriales bacterium]MDY5015423.1 acetate kinase [Eubacteriales bacterium]